jgi:hypothetical protein
MFYRVIAIGVSHDSDRPEIDVFYIDVGDKSIADLVCYIVQDETWSLQKWYSWQTGDTSIICDDTAITEFEKCAADVKLDETTCDFEGQCCPDCHQWFIISEYHQEKLYKLKN